MVREMVVLFPDYALRQSTVDPDFSTERAGALDAGFEVALYSHEAAVAGDMARAVKRCPPREGVPAEAALRGWMLTGGQYAGLHAALLDRGYALVNSPAAYEEVHYLPKAYPTLDGNTPVSLWTDLPDVCHAWRLYQQLRDGDVILKDHVKSAKHRWVEACFIPAGSDEERFRKTLEAFLAERGDLFERGFVLRRYVPLVTRGEDMRGYPVAKESRLFFFDGKVLIEPVARFAPPRERMDQFVSLAGRFQSRFMTMDVAQTQAGNWIVIEVGDGGVGCRRALWNRISTRR